jgi:hypothetical protein
MSRYLLSDQWAGLVRDFKDSEKEHGHSAAETERLARFILDYIANTRFRQYNMFTQQRGEEYERMFKAIESLGLSVDSARRMVYDEPFWKTTLEMAEQ